MFQTFPLYMHITCTCDLHQRWELPGNEAKFHTNFSTLGASTTTAARSCSLHSNRLPCCGADSSFPRPSSSHHQQHGRASTDGALISSWVPDMDCSFNPFLINYSILSVLLPGMYSTFDEGSEGCIPHQSHR